VIIEVGLCWFNKIAPYVGDEGYEKQPTEHINGSMRIMLCLATHRADPDPGLDDTWWGTTTTIGAASRPKAAMA